MMTKRELTDSWCAAYQSAIGSRYLFNGAKDGKAADRLLASGLTLDEILTVARWAWSHPQEFNAKFAASLSSFTARFNEIRYDCQTHGRAGGKSDRNAGTANEGAAAGYAKVGQRL
jgi:hypothetical protein